MINPLVAAWKQWLYIGCYSTNLTLPLKDMKLLARYNDVYDANNTASRLENMGIVTFVSGRQSSALSKTRTGTLKVGVWGILESQYEDANALFHNPQHKVTTGISEQQISQIKTQVIAGGRNSLLKNMIYIMLFLVVLIGSYTFFTLS